MNAVTQFVQSSKNIGC